MKIREASEQDIETIVEFQLKMAAETENLTLDANTVCKGVQRLFSEPYRGSYLVAEDSGEAIACLLTIPEFSDWRNQDVLWIHSVFVVPEARGSGVYRKMYEWLQTKVQKNESFAGLRLYVDKTNINAQSAYERLGMSDEHYKLYEWLKES